MSGQHDQGEIATEPVLGLALTWRLIPAILIPGSVLIWIGGLQLDGWPSAAIPFGLVRVLLVHLMADLPLALWLCWQLPVSLLTWPALRILVILAGVGLAVASFPAAGLIAQHSVDWSVWQNLVVRTLWILTLQLPWTLAAVASVRRAWGTRSAPLLADVFTAGLLLLVPGIYADHVIQRHSQLVADSLIQQQYLPALRATRRLDAMGHGEVAGRDSRQIVKELEEAIAQLRSDVQLSLPPDAPLQQRLQVAERLYYLAEFDRMKAVLGDLPTQVPAASYRLGMAYEVQRDWQQAVDEYRRTLKLLEQAGIESPAEESLLRRVYERLANNLRRAGRYRQAEQQLQVGLEQWPQYEASFLLQLGFHYQMAGRIGEAMDYLSRAAAADERMQSVVEARQAEMRRQAEGCLLRPTRGATR